MQQNYNDNIVALISVQLIIHMRTLSRENLRTFPKEPAIPRTLTLQKPVGASIKQSQIRIGKYKYDPKDELGKGFTGNVYKGVEILKQHKRYAIKVINLKKFKGHNLQLLQSQIEIHRSLNHQNIVKLFQVIKTTQYYYLILEYCPHGNLSQYIAQKKQLSESNTIEILNQLIPAYKYLLTEGVIHRDIKPANILRVGNKWKLSDFGFAVKSRFGFKDRMNVGTPLYMAPESLKKNYYSFKSDFYSIGILSYEMLTGQTPFQVGSQKQLLLKISHQINMPKNIKNLKLSQFMTKLCLISDAKRMNREDFQNFDFGSLSVSALGTHSNSCSVLSFKDRKGSTDESSLKHNIVTSTQISAKFYRRDMNSKQNSRQVSRQQSSSSKQNPLNVEELFKPVCKNPMLVNKEILQQEFQYVKHLYFTTKNMYSFHLEQNTKSMFTLALFKLLLKLMRLLCDKNQNYLQLNNWEEYQQCKLHQQLYSQFTLFSQKYEKEYLEFIKHNDIKVIRAVNRKFPQLCNNAPLNAKFYDNFKNFISGVVRQHHSQVSNLVEQGEGDQKLNDRFAALESVYKIYKFSQFRNNSPYNSLVGEKLIILQDYAQSKLTRCNFNNLKRLVKHI